MPKKGMKKQDEEKYMFKNGKEDWKCRSYYGYHKGCGGIYFLGFIGAAIYYLQTSVGFWNGVLGILKACVWPAFLIYKLLGM